MKGGETGETRRTETRSFFSRCADNDDKNDLLTERSTTVEGTAWEEVGASWGEVDMVWGEDE